MISMKKWTQILCVLFVASVVYLRPSKTHAYQKPIDETIWKENRFFLSLFFFLFLVGLLPFFFFDSVTFFSFIKQWHHPIADGMAPYLSAIGNGLFYECILCLLALLRVRCKNLLIFGGSFVCMSLVVQVLKRVVFADSLRPSALVAMESMHVVDGIKLLTNLSLPSGHAGTIFTMATVVQLLSKQKKGWHACALCLFACLVSYSRVYLCQHFYRDIYVGACIGVGSSLLVYRMVHSFQHPLLDWSIYGCIRKIWKHATA
ncbi:MAG TPA: phosphatase PAP2 family protein [Amoebophilaceae bacterium]|nr:phosphatase PAP2 family protein [Amoebophilaceae bacterium]